MNHFNLLHSCVFYRFFVAENVAPHQNTPHIGRTINAVHEYLKNKDDTFTRNQSCLLINLPFIMPASDAFSFDCAPNGQMTGLLV
jgi:hypothetical protein